MTKKNDGLESIVTYVSDLREGLSKTVGDDDLASLIDVLREDMIQIMRVLLREGLAEESEFKTVFEEE